MKTTISLYDFRDAFQRMNRSSNFSHEGLEILFRWLEELETYSGVEEELDVIALCCDFAEASHAEIAKNYNIDLSKYSGDDMAEHDAVVDYLEQDGYYLGTTDLGLIVYRQH